MPNFSTRGAASRFGYAPPVTTVIKYSGSFGIFITSTTNSPVMLYDFTSKAVVTISFLGVPEQYYGAAAGNGQRAIIYMAGRGAPFVNTKRYVFSDATTTPGTQLTQPLSAGTAFGNATQSIVALAYNSTVTNKYIYATDTVSVASPLTVLGLFIGSIGNANYAITQIGNRGNSGNNKYTYAGDTVTAATAFPQSATIGGASIPTTGIIAFTGGTTVLYDYAASTFAVGPTTGGFTDVGSACGNNTIAVFARESGSTATAEYTYATNTFATGTALGFFGVGGVAVSNGVTGINI